MDDELKHPHRYYITIAGMNPHDVAAAMGEKENPFYDEVYHPGVLEHTIVDGYPVAGIVDFWSEKPLTLPQERYLRTHPNVVAVRHVWPGEQR